MQKGVKYENKETAAHIVVFTYNAYEGTEREQCNSLNYHICYHHSTTWGVSTS